MLRARPNRYAACGFFGHENVEYGENDDAQTEEQRL